jgi:tellurite resistance protein
VAFTLHKDAFVAIAAVTWADDRVSRGEREGLVRAAESAGLEGADLEAVSRATKERVSLDDFDPAELSGWQRAVTYALSCWLARVDGVLGPTEKESLQQLGDRLELPEHKLKSAQSAAFDVACLPGGHRPEKYDFAALVEKLKEKLPSLVE